MNYLLLSCCDQTPRPSHLGEDSVYLGLWVQWGRAHDGGAAQHPMAGIVAEKESWGLTSGNVRREQEEQLEI